MTIARGEAVMLEVVRRLKAATDPDDATKVMFKAVARADINPFIAPDFPVLVVQEPDETYDWTAHPKCYAIMTLPLMAVVRQATQSEKAWLVRRCWLAIWKAMLPPDDFSLGEQSLPSGQERGVTWVRPDSAAMIVSEDPQPLSTMNMRWSIRYGFNLTDPTVTA